LIQDLVRCFIAGFDRGLDLMKRDSCPLSHANVASFEPGGITSVWIKAEM
jgi:hypothetical protein